MPNINIGIIKYENNEILEFAEYLKDISDKIKRKKVSINTNNWYLALLILINSKQQNKEIKGI